MVYGYVRVSTNEQNIDGQQNLISRYCMDRKMMIDEWVEIEASSRKSTRQRKIDGLLQKIRPKDIVVTSELSRLGRSIKEVLNTIEKLVDEKQGRLICIKQNIDIDPDNNNDPTNKILVTIFSMMAELERDFISERTKEGLLARKAKGIKLGKPKGTVQKSMYDKDHDKITHLYHMGVPINKIIDTHLKYGKYLSLKKYIDRKCGKKDS